MRLKIKILKRRCSYTDCPKINHQKKKKGKSGLRLRCTLRCAGTAGIWAGFHTGVATCLRAGVLACGVAFAGNFCIQQYGIPVISLCTAVQGVPIFSGEGVACHCSGQKIHLAGFLLHSHCVEGCRG